MAKKVTTKSGKKSVKKAVKKATKKVAKKSVRKAPRGRELIKPKGDARYIRRDALGRIKESDDVGRSLRQDRLRKSKKKVRSGQGDRGDR